MNLIDDSTRLAFTGAFGNLFDSMSSGSNNFISIIKQPISVINNPNENVIAGYSPESMNINDITYQTISGVYPAVIIYPHQLNSNQFSQLKFQLDTNQVMIKVDDSCRNYLLDGKTERIFANNVAYNMELTPIVQNFWGLKYYYFKLTSTK